MRFVNFIKRQSPYTFLSIAIAAVSTAAVMIRFIQGSMQSLAIATYRLLFSTIILLPFSLRKMKMDVKKLSGKHWLLVFFSGFLLAAHFAAWISSLRMTNVISSVVLVTTTPIWVAIFSPLILKTRISARFILGLAVAFLGIVLLSFSDFGNDDVAILAEIDLSGKLMGNVLAIVGAFCAAGYTIIGRVIREKISNESYVVIVYGIATIFLLMLTMFSGTPLVIPGTTEFLWLLLLALIPQAVGHSLLNWSLGMIPAHIVSLTLLGEPIGSTILAMILFREFPTNSEWLYSSLILAGILIAIYRPNTDKGAKNRIGFSQ